jgi:hypothetical protein
MRAVKRDVIDGPASLLDGNCEGARELCRARTHFSTVPLPEKAFSFGAYKGDDVRHALEALFHGKCAYCETRYDVGAPVDIEHFRPKGEVADLPGHRGYWWLAAEWANLLPSCIDCNRRRYQPTPETLISQTGILERQRQRGFRSILTGKDSCFPVSGTRMAAEPPAGQVANAITMERALLLNPCTDVPSEHLQFHIDRANPLGLVFAKPEPGETPGALPALSEKATDIEKEARAAGISPRGAVSIQIYELNRLGLVQERTRVLRRLELLGDIVVRVSAAADALEALTLADLDQEQVRDKAIDGLRAVVDRTIAEIRAMSAPEAPYSTMVANWIQQFKDDMAAPSS